MDFNVGCPPLSRAINMNKATIFLRTLILKPIKIRRLLWELGLNYYIAMKSCNRLYNSIHNNSSITDITLQSQPNIDCTVAANTKKIQKQTTYTEIFNKVLNSTEQRRNKIYEKLDSSSL